MILSILVVVVVEGAAAIVALKWALPKSDAVFFTVFGADALVRLAALGLATWWLVAHQLPFVGPLLTFGFGFLAMSLLQIPFLYKAH